MVTGNGDVMVMGNGGPEAKIVTSSADAGELRWNRDLVARGRVSFGGMSKR